MSTMEATVENMKPYDVCCDPRWTEKVGVLADEFTVVGRKTCGSLLRAYFDWNHEAGRGPVNLESMLEALTCGVLWNVYAETNGVMTQGVVDQSNLLSTESVELDIRDEFSHFLSMLELPGEFEEEVRRMRRFAAFFSSCSATEVHRYLNRISQFGEWFRVRAEELLGLVTENVDGFRRFADIRGEYREDAALRNRHAVEYHLNLLSAVILNCAWRDAYEEKKRKLLVLPGCMRTCDPRSCRARITPLGMECTGCTAECSVNKARECAERHGVSTIVVEHQSTVFDQRHANAIRREGYAIIGVACTLSLQAGGWKAQNEGIAAQCLPLLFPGCARHWAEGEGIATGIDLDLLTAIISESNFVLGW